MTTGTPSADRPNVELEAVAARYGDRREERRERVLRRLPPVAAMSQAQSHRFAYPIARWAEMPRWSDGYSVGSSGSGPVEREAG